MNWQSKPIKTLTLVALLLAATGCAASTKSARPRLQPEAYVTAPCKKPIQLPDRELTQADVEKLWVRDREALLACGMTKEALVKWLKANGSLY